MFGFHVTVVSTAFCVFGPYLGSLDIFLLPANHQMNVFCDLAIIMPCAQSLAGKPDRSTSLIKLKIHIYCKVKICGLEV